MITYKYSVSVFWINEPGRQIAKEYFFDTRKKAMAYVNAVPASLGLEWLLTLIDEGGAAHVLDGHLDTAYND